MGDLITSTSPYIISEEVLYDVCIFHEWTPFLDGTCHHYLYQILRYPRTFDTLPCMVYLREI